MTTLTSEQLTSLRTLRTNDPAMFATIYPQGIPELDAVPEPPANEEVPADLGPILPKTVLIYSPANGWIVNVEKDGSPTWSKKREDAFKFAGEQGLKHLKIINVPDATLRRSNGKSFGFTSATTPTTDPRDGSGVIPDPVKEENDKGGEKTPTPPEPPANEVPAKPIKKAPTKKEKAPTKKEKAKEFELTEKDRSTIRFLRRCMLEGKDYGVFVPGDEEFDATCKRLEEADYLTLYSPIDAPDDAAEDHFKWTPLSLALFMDYDNSSRLHGDPEPEKEGKKPATYTLEELAQLRKVRPKAFAKLCDENGVVKNEHIAKPKQPSKAESKRRDAEAGKNILNTEQGPEPWMADNVAAKICRLADREVMNIRDVISTGNFLARCEIDPKELTEEVIVRAEALERLWRGDVRALIERYNRLGVQVNKAKGLHVEEPVKAEPITAAKTKAKRTTEEKKEQPAKKERFWSIDRV